MGRILFALLLATAWIDGHAQSSLPPCPTSAPTEQWTNCYGLLTMPSGATFFGELKNGKRDGWGVQASSDGSSYDGEWKDDKFNGLGTFKFSSMEYVGEWRDGKMRGQGTMTYSDGKKYVGEWSENKKNGRGTFTWPDGMKYVGEWRDNNRHGQATHSWPDGKKYVGEYKDDNRSFGKFISAQGYTIAEGIWIDELTVSSYGTSWKIIADVKSGTTFVSLQSIRQEGAFRRAWFIDANHEPDSETRRLSTRALVKFDCAKERYQDLTATTHSGTFGTGEILSSSGESGWQYAPPTTVIFGLMSYVCDYKLTPKK